LIKLPSIQFLKLKPCCFLCSSSPWPICYFPNTSQSHLSQNLKCLSFHTWNTKLKNLPNFFSDTHSSNFKLPSPWYLLTMYSLYIRKLVFAHFPSLSSNKFFIIPPLPNRWNKTLNMCFRTFFMDRVFLQNKLHKSDCIFICLQSLSASNATHHAYLS
jgi:hypothetical protein